MPIIQVIKYILYNNLNLTTGPLCVHECALQRKNKK